MMELTRNESADKIKHIWATVVEKAPESTGTLRGIDAALYITLKFDTAGVHKDHLGWIVKALGNKDVLDCVDELAFVARSAGGELAAPWRDADDEEETEGVMDRVPCAAL